MANLEHLDKLNEGVAAWNEWVRAMPGFGADLQKADLSGKDLSGFDLRNAQLQGANLRGTEFGPGTLLWEAKITEGADLCQADFCGAELDKVDFTRSDLFQAKFREANLRGADLSDTDGFLRTEELAGADLTGAKLPEPLKKLYESLENVKGISESARKIFLAVLAACLYCWLTIATTTDVNLITNRASSPLPIIQTQIPIVGFYMVAPLLVLCTYFYFHFYLQKLWEELGSLPAIFPDGRSLHTKIDPWLLNDLVRAHLPKLSAGRPFLSYLQLWISVLLAWWVVPITMLLFWGRHLRRHEPIGTAFHVVLLVISVVGAVRLHQLAVATLRGSERRAFGRKTVLTSRPGYLTGAFAVVVLMVFGLVSVGAIWGHPLRAPIYSSRGEIVAAQGGVGTWVPRWMAILGYPPFADLRGAEVSQKKPGWNSQDYQSDSVIGVQLDGVNLRYALAMKSFFAAASLEGSDLRRVQFTEADLRGAHMARANLFFAHLWYTNLHRADLTQANLSGAFLFHADLSRACLSGANMKGTKLISTDLTYADLRETHNLEPAGVKMQANHWDQAFYSDGILRALGLPADHNEKLEEQLKKETELKEKQNAGQVASSSSQRKQ